MATGSKSAGKATVTAACVMGGQNLPTLPRLSPGLPSSMLVQSETVLMFSPHSKHSRESHYFWTAQPQPQGLPILTLALSPHLLLCIL